MNLIKICLPNACHGYGIEYNFNLPEADNGEAETFIKACKENLNKQYGWFWQCGSDTRKGYQYFEMLGCNDENILFAEAEKIANIINAKIDI